MSPAPSAGCLLRALWIGSSLLPLMFGALGFSFGRCSIQRSYLTKSTIIWDMQPRLVPASTCVPPYTASFWFICLLSLLSPSLPPFLPPFLFLFSHPCSPTHTHTHSSPPLLPQVVEGLRLPVPRGAPSVVAKIMKACWHKNPAKRPSFLLISTLLSTKTTF